VSVVMARMADRCRDTPAAKRLRRARQCPELVEHALPRLEQATHDGRLVEWIRRRPANLVGLVALPASSTTSRAGSAMAIAAAMAVRRSSMRS